MAIRRIAAAIIAIGLVVGAVLVRRSGDDDSPAGPDTTEQASGDGAIIACVTDLAAVCDRLDPDESTLRVESWTTTVASITAGDGPDVWITFAPLHTLAAGSGEPVTVASSELIAVSRVDRGTVLESTCGLDDLWTCVGTDAGGSWTELGGDASWGKVLPGFADPATSAVGVLGLGGAASDYFGSTSFGSTQINADDGFFGWFTRLAGAVPADATADPLALLLRRPSAVNVVSATRAAFTTLAGSRSSEFAAAYPGPMARADVVVVATDGGGVPDALTTELATLLVDAGWSPPSTDPNNLPSANTLVRLRSLWEETR